jgi:hypothetical protein
MIDVAQNKAGSYEYGNELLGFMKCGAFLG